MKITIALSLSCFLLLNIHSKVEGEYTSFQCGEMVLKLNPDSTFKIQYFHFDSDYSKISEGSYFIENDTITILEKNIIEWKRFKPIRDRNKKVFEITDTLQIINKRTNKKAVISKKMVSDTTFHENGIEHKLFVLENGNLKTSSFYCGALSSRIKTHWAIFEKNKKE
jgi:hypothetical protein